MKLKISAGIIIVVVLAAFFFFNPSQDSRKNEIRILIDRAPLSFKGGQNSDVVWRRLTPLFEKHHYQLDLAQSQDLSDEFVLIPPDSVRPQLRFSVYRDETTRAVQFLRGKGDVLFNSISLAKTRMIQKTGRYPFFEAPGHWLQCLAFNLDDPILGKREVRRAVSLALPISDWLKYKYFGLARKSDDSPHSPNLIEAEKILDQAGYSKQSDGIRFQLRYPTTPVREGNEFALLVREALAKIGIEVAVTPIEASLFYTKVKRGDFQLMSSRIARSSENESLSEYFMPGGGRNYFRYRNTEIAKRARTGPITWARIHDLIARDLPCVPLFTWDHTLIISTRIDPDWRGTLDDSFGFLPELKLKQNGVD